MKSESSLRLGVAQMTANEDVSGNIDTVETLFRRSDKDGADLTVFPENSLFFRIRRGSPLSGLDLNGPEIARIEKFVNAGRSALMFTTAVAGAENKFRNSTLFFAPGQVPQVLYSKIHLFDVDVPGAPPVRESEVFSPGDQPEIFDFNGWRIGLSICYDLRFAELYLNYAQKVDLILVPSAFLVPTGKAHWHTLLRARAIESQCYVAAPAQSGEHRSPDGQTRLTYGHSLVVDPWGEVLSDTEYSPEVRVVELSKAPIEKVRRQIPMAGHRRLKRF